jgi:hypothetical protein
MSRAILSLYLPADTPPDLAAGKAAVSDLCRHATVTDLRFLLTKMWIIDTDPRTSRDDRVLAARAGALRAIAETELHRLLDVFAASLHAPHATRFRLDTDTGAGVDIYRDRPTDESHPWHIIYGHGLFPPGWTARIGAACGLLDPRATGPAVATVTFHAWAAP